MDTKGLQKEFISWCKSKNKSPKSEDETKQLFVTFMKEKHPEEYKQAVQNQQKQQQAQAKKAAHGTKLNYFKSLKNQCAEDEEVVYFKKGGSVKCGCKKKEDGGEINKAQKGSAVDKFKNRQKSEKKDIQWTNKDDRKLDSLVMRKEYHKKPLTQQGEKDLKDLKERFKKSSNKNKYEVQEEKCGGKVKKKEDGSKINKDCGGAVAKFKAAKCGSKLKKHLQGGSLNRIPFMQAGTPKGGIEKSDNTRVQKISNKGEGVYEQIPMNGWDFVPLVGTYREAQRLDQEDPNASKLGFATSMGMDLLGAGMVGPAIKATAKASRLSKLLKSRGFNKITEQGLYRSQPNTYMKVAPETIKHQYYNVTQPTVRFKQVPTVDVSGIALSPLVQTLRVPTQAMAH